MHAKAPADETPFLTEDEVVAAVCLWLEEAGCDVHQRCTTKERGVDILASRGSERWVIEAKGATSSFAGSRRNGKGFTSNQIIDRVMKGFFTATALAEDSAYPSANVGLAMPRSVTAERYVAKVAKAMHTLGVLMIWVEKDGQVSTRYPVHKATAQ